MVSVVGLAGGGFSVSEIKHTMTAEEFEHFKFALDNSATLIEERLLSIGIAVEKPPRAIVTQNEVDKVCGDLRLSVHIVDAILSRLNIRVVP